MGPAGSGARFPPFGRGERGVPHNRGMIRGGAAGRGYFGRGDGMLGRGQPVGRGDPARGGMGPAFPQRGMPTRGLPGRGVPLGKGDPYSRDRMIQAGGQGLPPPLLDNAEMERLSAAQRRGGLNSQDMPQADQNSVPGRGLSQPRDFHGDENNSVNVQNSSERFTREKDMGQDTENIPPSPFRQDEFVEEPGAVSVTPQPEADDEEGELVQQNVQRDEIGNTQPKASVF